MSDDAPEDFLDVVTRLRDARLRPEVVLEEVPAPQRIAPFALALSGVGRGITPGRDRIAGCLSP